MTVHHDDELSGLYVAGQHIRDAEALIRRYCGLTGETWAYAFYDAVPVQAAGVGPVDLLTASVMHPSLARRDLEWFTDNQAAMNSLLQAIPADASLTAPPPTVLDRLADTTAGMTDSAGRHSLLTKILHRHRPGLVAIDERHIARLYAQCSGGRGRLSYRQLLDALAADLTRPTTQHELTRIRRHLRNEGVTPVPTSLRLLDIASWMHFHR